MASIERIARRVDRAQAIVSLPMWHLKEVQPSTGGLERPTRRQRNSLCPRFSRVGLRPGELWRPPGAPNWVIGAETPTRGLAGDQTDECASNGTRGG